MAKLGIRVSTKSDGGIVVAMENGEGEAAPSGKPTPP